MIQQATKMSHQTNGGYSAFQHTSVKGQATWMEAFVELCGWLTSYNGQCTLTVEWDETSLQQTKHFNGPFPKQIPPDLKTIPALCFVVRVGFSSRALNYGLYYSLSPVSLYFAFNAVFPTSRSPYLTYNQWQSYAWRLKGRVAPLAAIDQLRESVTCVFDWWWDLWVTTYIVGRGLPQYKHWSHGFWCSQQRLLGVLLNLSL